MTTPATETVTMVRPSPGEVVIFTCDEDGKTCYLLLSREQFAATHGQNFAVHEWGTHD